jgi:DNA-binding MarR family transcriptional regulator
MSESTAERLPHDQVLHVASNCLCLKAQRSARALARRFDAVFRPFGLTNGQFSLMMALNAPERPTITRLAEFLAMDRTSLTAMLKPLERRGLVTVFSGERDRRARHVAITPDGVELLATALPIWHETHAVLDQALGPVIASRLRSDLGTLSASQRPTSGPNSSNPKDIR